MSLWNALWGMSDVKVWRVGTALKYGIPKGVSILLLAGEIGCFRNKPRLWTNHGGQVRRVLTLQKYFWQNQTTYHRRKIIYNYFKHLRKNENTSCPILPTTPSLNNRFFFLASPSKIDTRKKWWSWSILERMPKFQHPLIDLFPIIKFFSINLAFSMTSASSFT